MKRRNKSRDWPDQSFSLIHTETQTNKNTETLKKDTTPKVTFKRDTRKGYKYDEISGILMGILRIRCAQPFKGFEITYLVKCSKNRVSLVGKRGVAGVMAEKLLSITAAEALPGGLNYEKHSTTLTCTTRSSRAGG